MSTYCYLYCDTHDVDSSDTADGWNHGQRALADLYDWATNLHLPDQLHLGTNAAWDTYPLGGLLTWLRTDHPNCLVFIRDEYGNLTAAWQDPAHVHTPHPATA